MTVDFTRSIEHPLSMLSRVFFRLGGIISTYPWEVIAISFISIVLQFNNSKISEYEYSEENKGVELVLLFIAKCVAILYSVHQFFKLYKLGSSFLVGIGVLYAFLCVVPCLVFSINLSHLFEADFTDLSKAIAFYFLLMDITKAGLLAQFALSSSTQDEVRENIAQGMSIIGPTITLDTIVETLVIGVGTLSGVKRLEELCRYACISAVVNYFVFMIVFPACLSLILEFHRDRDERRPVWHLSTLTKILQQEEEQKPNPVLQRVKVIMSAGLVVVHAHSRWPVLIASKALQASKTSSSDFITQPSNLDPYMQKLFGSVEQVVIVAFMCICAFMHQYLESYEDLRDSLANAATSSPSRRQPVPYQSCASSQTIHSASSENLSISRNALPSPPTHSSNQAVSFIVGAGEERLSLDAADKSVQTDIDECHEDIKEDNEVFQSDVRSIEELKKILASEIGGAGLGDEEVILLAEKKIIQSHKLEIIVKNPKRGVELRRKMISRISNCGQILNSLPYANYDYKKVMGSCCENVIGYVPIPVGVAGPLLLDDELLYVPMATTEGCLVASTNRGCRALALSGGVKSSLQGDGMTRAPAIKMPSEAKAGDLKEWVEQQENFEVLKTAFDSTSRFARLKSIKVRTAGRYAFLRFKASTGDAMGMNMLSKGCDEALNKLQEIFPYIQIVSLSGNVCTDKKPAAINWIEGRGKDVICSAQIPVKVVKEVLKTDVASLVELNIVKNFIGSAVAGSIGGFNAQAANIVTAIYIATGQDPAQCVTSSNCVTQIWPEGEDLYINCTMPSIEVGTVGGGTFLPAQSSCLELLGVKGPSLENPGMNAAKLARVVCATVLAGELSLLSALAAGHLVRSHMTHNRSSVNISSTPRSSVDNVSNVNS